MSSNKIWIKPHSAVKRLFRPMGEFGRSYIAENPKLARIGLRTMQKVSTRRAELFFTGDIEKREARLALLTIGLLGIPRTAKILDIGSRDNLLTKELQKLGFRNAKGIDRDPNTKTAKGKFGEMVDFFDLSMNEIYDLIHTRKTLDYMEGGNATWDCSGTPIAMYARHIFFHLNPGGTLIFSDFAPNTPEFIEELNKLGFTRIHDHRTYYYIFQKPY